MNESPQDMQGGAVALQDLLQHGSWIRGLCRSLVGSADGDDLAQETWLVALRRSDRTGEIDRPRPWLASVARRLAFDRWKRSTRETAALEAPNAVLDSSQPGAEAAEVVQKSELAHVVAGEILALAEPNRSTLLLRYFEGLDAAQIATRLGVPHSTVRSRIRRGLEEVREALDRRHGGDRSRWLAAVAPIVLPVRTRPAWIAPAAITAALASAVMAIAIGSDSAPAHGVAKDEATAFNGDRQVAALIPAQEANEEQSARQPLEVPAEVAPTSTTSALVAPRVRWSFPAGQSAPPLVVGDRILSVDQQLTCLSTEDGSVLWQLAAGDSWWVGSPAYAEGRLFLTHSTGGVACFALEDGRTIWQQPYEELGGTGQPCAVARTADALVCVIGTKSGVSALSADDGTVLWKADLGSSVELRPATDGEVVLCGTRGGTFASVSLQDGEVLWKHDAGSQYGWTHPVVADGVVYIGDRGKGGSHRKEDGGKLTIEVEGNRGGALNAFDIGTGELLWGRIFGSTGFSVPFVTETDVWGGFGTVVLPFKREDGSVTEDRVFRSGRNPFGSPRVLGDRLITGNLDGHLYAYDAETTELVWKWTPIAEGDRQVGGWTAAHGRLYVSTTKGLFALEDPPNAKPVEAGALICAETGEVTVSEAIEEATAKVQMVKAPNFANAYQIANEWCQKIAPTDDNGELQKEQLDPVQAATAMDEVRVALASQETARLHAALVTVARVQRFQDVTDLRWLVEPQARSGKPALRVSALYALWAVGPAQGGTRADDLALVHAAWEEVDADGRMKLPHLMSMFGEGRIEGRSEELVMTLLEQPGGSFRQWVNGLWGSRVTDRIALRLVELASEPAYEPFAYDAMYYALSTFYDKQPEVVAVLLEAVSHPDPNWSHRAAWGLTYGIPEAQKAGLVDAVLARMDGWPEHVQNEAAQIVRAHGTQQQIDSLGD